LPYIFTGCTACSSGFKSGPVLEVSSEARCDILKKKLLNWFGKLFSGQILSTLLENGYGIKF